VQNNEAIESVFRVLSKVQNVFETRRLKYLGANYVATPVTIQPTFVAPGHHTIDMPATVVMDVAPAHTPQPAPTPVPSAPVDPDVEMQVHQDEGELENVPIDGEKQE
jgi:hypothetical protein